MALSYAAGPITAGLAYEVNGSKIADRAEWLTVNFAWNFGVFKLGGFYGTGTTSPASTWTCVAVTATMPTRCR